MQLFLVFLALAFLSHPLTLIAILASIGIVGAVVAAAGSPLNFGAFTQSNAIALMQIAGAIYNTFAAGVTTGTIGAGILTGANGCYLNSASTTPGNQATRTAAQLYNDWCAALNVPNLPVNFTWEIFITQTGAGTMTITAGTSVTLTGTMTIAQNTTRSFIAQFTQVGATPLLTITSIGTGTYS